MAGTNGPNVEQCYLILSAAAVWSGSVRKHDALAVQHHDYLLELERSGVLFGAGPYEGAGGWADDDVAMTIVRAEDRAATDAIVQADPLVRAGVRTARVVPWWRNGARCVWRFDSLGVRLSSTAGPIGWIRLGDWRRPATGRLRTCCTRA